MKQISFNIICGIFFIAFLFSSVSLKAQKSKKEARVKIVCIEDGKKTIVDTVLTDFIETEEIIKVIKGSHCLHDSLITKTLNTSLWFSDSDEDKKTKRIKLKTICFDDDKRLKIDSLIHFVEIDDLDETIDVDVDLDMDIDFDVDDDVIIIKKRVLKKEHDDGVHVKVIKMGDKDGRVMIIHEDDKDMHIKCKKEIKRELKKEKRRMKKERNKK